MSANLKNIKPGYIFASSFFFLGSLFTTRAAAAELSFRGSDMEVLSETPERNTGLDRIYIIYDVKNVDLLYNSSNPENVKIYRYSNLGGGFAEQIDHLIIEDDHVIVENMEGNMGYIVEEDDNRYYFWVVNYHPYRFQIDSVEEGERDCDATYLNVNGSGEPIHFYTINGQQRTLDRRISVSFDTQVWDSSSSEFKTVESVTYFESLTNPLRITPPVYCSTTFAVSGDQFLHQWDLGSQAESTVISPTAVMIQTEAIQEGRDSSSGSVAGDEDSGNADNPEGGDESGEGGASDGETGNRTETGSNQISSSDDALGGSAPASITFTAYTTEGVLHDEWQLTRDPNFEDIEYRFNQKQIDYTFTEEGTYYMRFVGANADGSCEASSDVYTINIGASELKCPNAFTPDGDGVNDEWKVSYRSLLSFKCWIFDRFGQQIYYFSDPSLGWDGKRGGKLVPPGVYYYVIQAEGADGKRYKKSGDINILRHRNASSTSTVPSTGE